ncbi:hypothetical protein B0H14DRAFT_3448997 [Mycena olivaceomarginata]|nr:hypothetical protein B0H14DRAFT_3448997 [Mycena olivaceomarginata]
MITSPSAAYYGDPPLTEIFFPMGLPFRYLEAHLKDAFGGMLTFHVEGGFEQVKKVINNLELASRLANLGDAKTLVITPFITVQSQLTPPERELTGVTDDTIRHDLPQ